MKIKCSKYNKEIEKSEIENIINNEKKEGDGIVCEENARYRAYVNLKLKKQKKVLDKLFKK